MAKIIFKVVQLLLLLIQYNQITKKLKCTPDKIFYMAWEKSLNYFPDSGLQLAPKKEKVQKSSARVNTVSLPMNLEEFKIDNPTLHHSVPIMRVILPF